MIDYQRCRTIGGWYFLGKVIVSLKHGCGISFVALLKLHFDSLLGNVQPTPVIHGNMMILNLGVEFYEIEFAKPEDLRKCIMLIFYFFTYILILILHLLLSEYY